MPANNPFIFSYLYCVHDNLECEWKRYASINRLLQQITGRRRREKKADHGEAVRRGREKKGQEECVVGHENESSGIW